MKLMSTADNRQCANKGRLLITAILEKVYFLFIALKRMETIASLRSATVGSGRRCCKAFVLVLRACSYKAKAEAWQQGNAPYSSMGGCRFLFIVMTQMNTDILVDNQRNLRENSFCLSVET